MLSQDRALCLIQDSLNSLRRSGLIEQDVAVHGETVLLGVGSPLDSIAFVTFITDLEDRLSQEMGTDLFLVLNEVSDFNVNNPNLSADTLARYMVKLTE